MAARAVLAGSTSSLPLPSIHSFNSPFHSVSLNLSRHSLPFPLTLAAAPSPRKPIVAANEAASALNCTSNDEGLLNLTQDFAGLEEAIIFDSEILLSEPDDELGPVAAVPKKRTSKSKKNIRKNVWKRKGAVAAMKAYSLAKSILTGKSTSFMTDNLKKDT